MSKYTTDNLFKKSRKLLTYGDVIKNIHLGDSVNGEDYNQYKYVIIGSRTFQGHITYTALAMNDYKNSIFVENPPETIELYGGTTTIFDKESQRVSKTDEISTYERCSDDELSTVQKIISNYFKTVNSNAYYKEAPNMIIRLTADLDSNIKSGSYACVKVAFSSNGKFGFHLRVIKKTDKGILTFGRPLSTEDLQYIDGISEYVNDPPASVLEKYTSDSMNRLLSNITIPTGSFLKHIDQNDELQNLSKSPFTVSQIYFIQLYSYYTVNDEGEHKYEIPELYKDAGKYYNIFKLAEVGENGKELHCDDVLAKYKFTVKDGSVIQSKNDPSLSGLLFYDSFNPSDKNCQILFKNSDTGLCYVKSVNTESITREEYEVTRNMKDRQTNRSSAGVKARAWREFCGLVPGAQIEFVTEYTNGPFITVEKGTKGYVIEKKQTEYSYTLTSNEEVVFVAKMKGKYITSDFQIPRDLVKPLVKVLKQTNVKDRSIFTRVVKVEDDINSQVKFYDYSNINTIGHYIFKNINQFPEIKQIISPNYGEFKLLSREDCENILTDAALKRFFYVNDLDNEAKQRLLDEQNIRETFYKLVERSGSVSTFMPRINFIITNLCFSNSQIVIKIIDPGQCDKVQVGNMYEVENAAFPYVYIRNYKSTDKFQRINLKDARFEVVSNLTDSQKDSINKISPVDNSDSVSINNLIEAWREDMLKFLGEEPGPAKYRYPDSFSQEWETKDILELGGYSGEGGPEDDDVDCPDTDAEFKLLYGDKMYHDFCDINGLEYLPLKDSLRNKNTKALIYAFIEDYDDAIGFESIETIIEDAIERYNDN